MHRAFRFLTGLFPFVVLCSGFPAAAATPLTTTRIASGLTKPLFLTHAPGDFHRLFVVEQDGRIKIIKDGVLQGTPFLDIDSIVNSTTLEWGLLGLAFHPDYQNNGYFYVNYSDAGGNSVIARFQRINADQADAASRQTVLFIAQPNANHRGGWLAFGPDGYFYDSQGDGGGQNDPSNRGQNINLLQGKILRLDVDGLDNIPGNGDDDAFPGDANKNYSIPPGNPFVGVTGEDEIWAYGLRNPWRCSFDRLLGNLWIADVGQFQREELDYQPAGFAGGANYGWRCMEAELCTGMTGCTCGSASLTAPIHFYDHTVGLSITGGYVYRGCAIPDLKGVYFFADYQTERIWSLKYNGTTVSAFTERTTELDPPGALTVDQISSFGEDAYGELYICDLGGEIFKIIPAVFVGPDCNANAVCDVCDTRDGSSADVNSNEVPDECECPTCRADTDHDNVTDAADIPIFVDCYLAGPAAALGCHCCDVDFSGGVDDTDLALFVDKILGVTDPLPACP